MSVATSPAAPPRRTAQPASRIRLTVLCAKNLFRGRIVSFNYGLPDVYCKIESGGQTFTTETCTGTANPKWRAVYDLLVTKSEPLLITLWNEKRTSKGQRGFLGCVRVKLTDINTLKDTSYQRLSLQKLNESDNDTVKGEIIVSILSRQQDATRSPHNRSSTQNNVVITDQSADRLAPAPRDGVTDAQPGNGPATSRSPAAALTDRPPHRSEGERRSSGTRNPLDRSRASSARLPKSERRSVIQSDSLSSSNPQICADANPSPGNNQPALQSANNSISNRVPAASRHLRGNSLTDGTSDLPRITRGKSSPHLRHSSIPVAIAASSSAAPSSSQLRNCSAGTGLPAGYEMILTQEGQVQYVHVESGAVSWYDPRVKELVDKDLNLDELVGPLPPGWELRQSNNRTYFVNHVNRTTQLTDPRLLANREALSRIPTVTRAVTTSRKVIQAPAQSKSSKPPMPLPDQDLNSNFKQPNRKVLVQKMQALRQDLTALQPQTGHCRLEVSRDDLFEESYRGLMKMKAKELKKKLMVKFRGEEGIDYGGVAREWLYLLSREMLNPCYGLFLYTHEGKYTLHINPNSAVNPDHLSYFHFVGRVLGLALFHGHHIGATFSLTFYRMLLNKAITLDDIRVVDGDLHRGLKWMLNNDINGVLIDASFSVDHNCFGEHQVLDLIPNGRNVPVTEENKEEYVRLFVNYRFKRGIEHQFQALLKGFHEVVPPESLLAFDEKELELMISGFGQIDIDDWKSNTRLKHCTADSPIVKWFWKVVESYSEEKRARLLQFVTGSPRVPLQGFKALQGTTGASEPRLFTINQIDASTDNLPQAHTCFNRIDIPPYESFAKLQEKLTQAVDETDGFALD